MEVFDHTNEDYLLDTIPKMDFAYGNPPVINEDYKKTIPPRVINHSNLKQVRKFSKNKKNNN